MTRKIETADSKSSMARNMNCIDAKHKKAKITTEWRKLHDQRHNIKDIKRPKSVELRASAVASHPVRLLAEACRSRVWGR